ncbi:FadR/GntR family transcriptional regulator [Microbacterium sp. SD291]|uniref:FadR/GntR family transcriptional regulator n=1 Tax=Microbacterium sp. SD291 TaxID=2782007 RepID=UPI001A973362|nr:FCD domain-containing protein [Microbacterium sp. SD291]MBO0981034.1 FadR family transcriptional regulator [Microbacterium sp. SD291]
MPADLHGDVLDDLGSRIVSGELAEGEVLTLAQLEAEYGASRTLVREAVRVLESMGMLASRRRVGITVQPRSRWDEFDAEVIQWTLRGPDRQQHLEALMELRVAVEPMAAGLAARRASAEQRVEIRRLAEVLDDLGRRGLGDTGPYLDADLAFHSLVLAASGNPLLAALERPVREVLAGRTRLGLHPSTPAPGTLEQHLRVAVDIAGGDAAAAEQHSREHLSGVWGEIAPER